MTTLTILELMREYSDITSTDVSDVIVNNTYIIQALAWLDDLLSTTITVTLSSTGDALLDAIVAQFTCYFTYLGNYQNRIDTSDGESLYLPEVHYQRGLGLLMTYDGSSVKRDPLTGNLVPSTADNKFFDMSVSDNRENF